MYNGLVVHLAPRTRERVILEYQEAKNDRVKRRIQMVPNG